MVKALSDLHGHFSNSLPGADSMQRVTLPLDLNELIKFLERVKTVANDQATKLITDSSEHLKLNMLLPSSDRDRLRDSGVGTGVGSNVQVTAATSASHRREILDSERQQKLPSQSAVAVLKLATLASMPVPDVIQGVLAQLVNFNLKFDLGLQCLRSSSGASIDSDSLSLLVELGRNLCVHWESEELIWTAIAGRAGVSPSHGEFEGTRTLSYQSRFKY